jgi:hypothetical protein
VPATLEQEIPMAAKTKPHTQTNAKNQANARATRGAQRVDPAHRLDLIAPPLDADRGVGLVGREHLDRGARDPEPAAVEVDIVAFVLRPPRLCLRAEKLRRLDSTSPLLEENPNPTTQTSNVDPLVK